MLGANPCVVAVEFQCFVSNQANIFRSKSTIFGNPVILKPSRISKVVEAPRDTAIYRYGHSKSSFSLAVLVRGLQSIDQSENGCLPKLSPGLERPC